ncbi:MAG: CvpA family protein [Muribaculaceae bacterium]|nr:CvpA family protein [Muribaculaceae bacterium]
MSAFDIFVIIVALAGAVLGFRKGLIAQAGQIIALMGGIMVCRIFGPQAVAMLSPEIPAPAADTAIAYALLFIAAYFIILLVARLVRGVISAVHLGVLDRLAGAVFKACVWLLILSVLLNVWAALIPGSDLTDTRAHPRRAFIMRLAPAINGYVIEKATK